MSGEFDSHTKSRKIPPGAQTGGAEPIFARVGKVILLTSRCFSGRNVAAVKAQLRPGIFI
jgi:hypothetical protein